MKLTTKTTKIDLTAYLAANGIVVEGDEKKDELLEAARYLAASKNNVK